MAKRFFDELRERLLRAGVAPRHVRRYLAELADHFADLRAEEQSAGRGGAEAESAAIARLGTMDDLARAMTERPEFQAWCARAPWAAFGVAPVLLLAASWCVTLLVLWLGWQRFLPGEQTPFGRHSGHSALFALANVVFQGDQALYYLAPILVGWGVALVAARQRVKAWWPIAGLVLIACVGGAAQVHASQAPGGHVNIGIGLDLVPSVLGNLMRILQASVILLVTLLPYLIWRGGGLDQEAGSFDPPAPGSFDAPSFDRMVRRPSAFLPLAMSLGALTMLLVPIAIGIAHPSGLPRDPDGGTIAHVWQLLMTVQIPIVLFFAVKWLRRAPGQTVRVLALQAGAWLASCAPVYFLHL